MHALPAAPPPAPRRQLLVGTSLACAAGVTMYGGMLALYLFCRRRKLNFLMWADIAVPAMALGQAIGRWGNYVNQELYGKPSDLPWAITISAAPLAGICPICIYHPLFHMNPL
jgi:prolipoprotein diacylglyceryltransferase